MIEARSRRPIRRGRGARVGLACLAVLLLLPATSGARPPHARHGPPGGLVARHAERLGLDDETRERIERIVEASRERDEALRERILAARREMREILSAPSPDPDTVMAQAEEIGRLETEAHKHRLRTILEIRAELTPEQREELIRIRKERGGKHRFGPLGRCTRDLQAHCAEAPPGRAALACLERHWEALSPACREAFDPSEPGKR